MAVTIKHAKTDTIADWTQADLDAQIALGNFPPGTLLADIVLPSDWNDDHTFTGTLPIANGGTGQTTANAAINALLPSQSSQSGKVLSTDGTNTSWIAAGGTGTVTSVTGTSPVSVANSTTTPVISMPAATASIDGYLTSTDWTTFSNKAPATSGTSILYGNGSGGFSNVTVGSGLSFSTGTLSATGGTGDVVGPASATDNAITRFDTTTGKLIQNSTVTLDDTGNIINANSLGLDTTPGTVPTTVGTMSWDDGDGVPIVAVKGGNVNLQVGTQELARVYNDSGTTLTKGQVVYISGAQGNRVAVKLARADVEATSFGTIGLVAETIASGAEGFIIVSGALYKLNTTGLTAGATVYLSPSTAGAVTTTKPQAPDQLVVIGWVERVDNIVGSIYVKIDNGYELDELHDVRIISPISGNMLIYDASTSPIGVWKNANLTAGTGISVTNGAGSVTVTNSAPDQTVAISGTSPVSVTGTYPNFTVSMTQSSGSTNGWLSSTNWNTFNNKANSGANTDITSVALTTGTISTAPSSSTDIVNKSYADSIASNVNFHAACKYATTTALPTNTYNNGSSGVGATLTATANGALSVDGSTVTASDRVLVKDEATQANNGVYTVTQVGSGSLPYILTRATDFNTAGSGVNQIDQGDLFLITNGTANANTSWVQQTPLPITVGTTAIVFIEFAKTQTYTAGTGLTLSTNQFSISNIGTAGTYGSATLIPVITTNAQGQVTGVTTAANPQGTVTNVSALTLGTTGTDLSSTVANDTTTPVITLNVPTASATNRGALSSADWTTFNNKGNGTVTSVSGTGSVNGITLTGTVTAAGSLTLGGTLGSISNSQLTNSAITINGTSTSLGGSISVGTVTSASVVSANGFAGSVATATTTPAITISTSVTGVLKGNGTAISAATAGTDYGAPGTASTWTASQRGTVTTDNDLSFDMSVTNNFKCTPTALGTLTFTNITAGQSGFILLINSGGFAISAAATTEVAAGALTTISTAGSYLLSYFTDGTLVYVTNSGALA